MERLDRKSLSWCWVNKKIDLLTLSAFRREIVWGVFCISFNKNSGLCISLWPLFVLAYTLIFKHSICLYTALFFSENRQCRQTQKLVGVRVSGGDLCEAEAPTEATAETTPNPLSKNRQYCRRKIKRKSRCAIKNTTAIIYNHRCVTKRVGIIKSTQNKVLHGRYHYISQFLESRCYDTDVVQQKIVFWYPSIFYYTVALLRRL